MHLLENHPNRKLHIIGVGGDEYFATIPQQFRRQSVIESESRSTYENSLAVRKIAETQNLRRVVIVTTEDHMNRSLLLMRRALEGTASLQNTKVLPCPVRLQKMPPTERLTRWGLEYIKYAAALFGIYNKNAN
jgi:uncharacterized SAM-binding protein YcdF (DUF218 family)